MVLILGYKEDTKCFILRNDRRHAVLHMLQRVSTDWSLSASVLHTPPLDGSYISKLAVLGWKIAVRKWLVLSYLAGFSAIGCLLSPSQLLQAKPGDNQMQAIAVLTVVINARRKLKFLVEGQASAGGCISSHSLLPQHNFIKRLSVVPGCHKTNHPFHTLQHALISLIKN